MTEVLSEVLGWGRDVRRRLGPLGRDPFSLIFVVMALPVGVFLVFAQPPGQGLDEAAHFYRVWTLANGLLVDPTHHGQTGAPISQCVLQYLNHFAAAASRRSSFSFEQYWHNSVPCSSKTTFTGFPGSAVYSPVAYVPSIVAVWLLHLIGFTLPVVFFAGRLTSLLTFVALYALAIKIAPVGKPVLFVLGLLPTTLLLASTYSADPMTIALAVLSASLTLRCCTLERPVRRDFLWLFVVLVALALAKPSFFVLAFLLFVVPVGMLGVRHPRLVQTATAAVVLGCAAAWNFSVRKVLSAATGSYGINPHAQIRYILGHPLGYGAVLARTLFESSGEQRWLPGIFFSIGFYRPFGDNIYAPMGLVILGSLTVCYTFWLAFGKKRDVALNRPALVWLPIAIAVVGFLLIETTLFVYGTPVGLPEINVQGRYFFPLVPLPLVTIALIRRERVVSRSTRWILLGSGLMLVWLVLKVFVHDYSL
jgi:uncharacterized membrane protein